MFNVGLSTGLKKPLGESAEDSDSGVPGRGESLCVTTAVAPQLRRLADGVP